MHDEKEEPKVEESEIIEFAKKEGLLEENADAMEASDESDAESGAESELDPDEQNQIMSSIEAILFMSDKPVSLARLRSLIGEEHKVAVYRNMMKKLREDFASEHRGVEISAVNHGFQLRTKPQMSAVLRKMVKTQPVKLTSGSLEVLAIIAYKQPVIKDDVDQIRGVDSGYMLRNLMEKKLIKIIGRSELPGRPMLYGTSHEFLEIFNLKDLKALPPLHEVEAMVAASEAGIEDEEKDAFDKFNELVKSSSTVLFEEGGLDKTIEDIREQIAAIPTSTPFIEEQKLKEKLQMRLANDDLSDEQVAEIRMQIARIDGEVIEEPTVEDQPIEAAAVETAQLQQETIIAEMQQQAAQTQETEAPSAEEPTAPQEKPEETNV